MRRGSALFLALLVALTMSAVGIARGAAQDAAPSKLASLGLPELVVTETAAGLSAASDVPAGLTLVTLDNQADHFGEAQFVQLPDDVTGDDLLASLDSDVTPDWLYTVTWSGGPTAVPGATGHAVVNLTPGQWT